MEKINKKIFCVITTTMLSLSVVNAQKVALGFHSTNGNYWQMKSESLQKGSFGKAQVVIRTDDKQQTFKGWGTTFNELDYDAWNLLSESDKQLYLKRVFNPYGDLRLSVGRIPVGASDYACSWYSYDETEGNVPDENMTHFTIERDKQKVIPSIKDALKENPNMTFWASLWSPPQWMKTNKHYSQRKTNTNGGTTDVPPYDNDQFDAKYYNAYCLYLDKFINAYKSEDIQISALAYQNEAYSYTPYPGCSWKAATTGKFLAEYLGPYMAEHQPELKLIVGTMNTNRYDVYNTILSTPNIDKYCKQIGFQWEGGQQIAAVRKAFPNYELVMTESECGSGTFDWNAAVHTFQLCNHYLANGVTTYTYWNTILKDKGLSTWGWQQNALIQVNSTTKTAKYCPEYYAYKHYTHFIPAGSEILTCDESKLVTSALAPDGSVIIVIGNDDTKDKTMAIDVDGETLVCTLAPKSFATYVVASKDVLKEKLKNEAKGIVEVESASINDAQRDALTSAISSGDYSTLQVAVAGVLNNTLVNPNFQSGVDGWTVNNVIFGKSDCKVDNILGKTCYNNWSDNFASLDIHQDVFGIKPGLYQISAKSVCGEGNITNQHVYAETESYLVKSPVKKDDKWNAANWETQTTDIIYVKKDDVLRIGYASTSGGGTKGWFCVTDFELKKVGDLTADFNLDANKKVNELDEAKAKYKVVADEAKKLCDDASFDEISRNELKTIIEACDAKLENITNAVLVNNITQELNDNFEAFKITQKGDATFKIRNAKIEQGTKDGWLRDNNNASGYSEKPDAIQSDVYNGYGVSHWRASAIQNSKLIYQTIESLPKGHYRLTAYAAATVWNNNNGNANKPGVYVFANDSKTEVTSAKYNEYSVDFTLDKAGSVTLGLMAEGNQGNNWCFLSDVKLVYLDKQINYSLGDSGYGTLILPYDADLPSGVEAYTCKSLKGNVVETEKQTYIPANTPLLIKGNPGKYTFNGVSTAKEKSYTQGLLIGELEATKITNGYVLQKQDGIVAFYKVEADKPINVPAYRCYLTVPSASKYLSIDFDNVTGISNVNAIGKLDVVYDLFGHRIVGKSQGHHRIVIVNNKKVVK